MARDVDRSRDFAWQEAQVAFRVDFDVTCVYLGR